MTGRWACRQVDVLAELDRELEAACGHLFAALDAAALLANPERLRERLGPFMPGGS